MLRFLALCGPNEQKFGELLTWPKVISPPKLLPNLFTESWETQHLKGKKHKPKFEFRTLEMSHYGDLRKDEKNYGNQINRSNYFNLIE